MIAKNNIFNIRANGAKWVGQIGSNKGFAEFDDVFHNTIGCMIGYGIYSLVSMGYEKAFKRHVAVL